MLRIVSLCFSLFRRFRKQVVGAVIIAESQLVLRVGRPCLCVEQGSICPSFGDFSPADFVFVYNVDEGVVTKGARLLDVCPHDPWTLGVHAPNPKLWALLSEGRTWRVPPSDVGGESCASCVARYATAGRTFRDFTEVPTSGADRWEVPRLQPSRPVDRYGPLDSRFDGRFEGRTAEADTFNVPESPGGGELEVVCANCRSVQQSILPEISPYLNPRFVTLFRNGVEVTDSDLRPASMLAPPILVRSRSSIAINSSHLTVFGSFVIAEKTARTTGENGGNFNERNKRRRIFEKENGGERLAIDSNEKGEQRWHHLFFHPFLPKVLVTTPDSPYEVRLFAPV